LGKRSGKGIAHMLDIRKLDAIGDGTAIDTAAIQATVDACSKDQSGHVLVTRETRPDQVPHS